MGKTIEQCVEELNKMIGQLENNIRIGTVLSTNKTRKTIRVSWSNGTQSGDMRVLENGTGWLPTVGEKVVSIHRVTGDGWVLGSLS